MLRITARNERGQSAFVRFDVTKQNWPFRHAKFQVRVPASFATDELGKTWFVGLDWIGTFDLREGALVSEYGDAAYLLKDAAYLAEHYGVKGMIVCHEDGRWSTNHLALPLSVLEQATDEPAPPPVMRPRVRTARGTRMATSIIAAAIR